MGILRPSPHFPVVTLDSNTRHRPCKQAAGSRGGAMFSCLCGTGSHASFVWWFSFVVPEVPGWLRCMFAICLCLRRYYRRAQQQYRFELTPSHCRTTGITESRNNTLIPSSTSVVFKVGFAESRGLAQGFHGPCRYKKENSKYRRFP